MSAAPIMPVFTSALIGDTTHLSTAEFGAYCLILFTTWQNNGVALADDDTRLARVCRVSTTVWRNKYRPALVGFFDVSDGFWHQKRLEKEWSFVQQKCAISRKNGARGGRPKSLKTLDGGNPAGLFQVPSGLTQNEPRGKPPIPIPIKKEEDSPPLTTFASPPANGEGTTHDNPNPKRSKNASGRGTRLSPDWQPSVQSCLFGESIGVDVNATADEFRNYWVALPGNKATKLDWERTFRNRCREVAARNCQQGRFAQNGANGHDRAAERARKLREAVEFTLAAGSDDEPGRHGPFSAATRYH